MNGDGVEMRPCDAQEPDLRAEAHAQEFQGAKPETIARMRARVQGRSSRGGRAEQRQGHHAGKGRLAAIPRRISLAAQRRMAFFQAQPAPHHGRERACVIEERSGGNAARREGEREGRGRHRRAKNDKNKREPRPPFESAGRDRSLQGSRRPSAAGTAGRDWALAGRPPARVGRSAHTRTHTHTHTLSFRVTDRRGRWRGSSCLSLFSLSLSPFSPSPPPPPIPPRPLLLPEVGGDGKAVCDGRRPLRVDVNENQPKLARRGRSHRMLRLCHLQTAQRRRGTEAGA